MFRTKIDLGDGRVFDVSTPEGIRAAQAAGVPVGEVRGKHIGNTPRQDHINDPLVTDPRPIRSLNTSEEAAIRLFARRGAWMAVAGFENWRGQDRWYYVDVLGVGRNCDEAYEKGLPIGPITADWVQSLRMVGDQLALRMLDPHGEARGRYRQSGW